MRVKMKESMPVTVDGVHTLDLEAGESYEVGDGVAADLIAAGAAEDAETPAAAPSRGRGKKKPAEDVETPAEPEPVETTVDESEPETKE